MTMAFLQQSLVRVVLIIALLAALLGLLGWTTGMRSSSSFLYFSRPYHVSTHQTLFHRDCPPPPAEC